MNAAPALALFADSAMMGKTRLDLYQRGDPLCLLARMSTSMMKPKAPMR